MHTNNNEYFLTSKITINFLIIEKLRAYFIYQHFFELIITKLFMAI